MSQINDGGPAFPIHTPESQDSGAFTDYGISMRDYFAGQALIGAVIQGYFGEIVKMSPVTFEEAYDQVAKGCYEQADAMLRARKL